MVDLLNKLYKLYLILFGAYATLLIGVVAYMIEIYRLYKQQKVVQEKMQREIINNKFKN